MDLMPFLQRLPKKKKDEKESAKEKKAEKKNPALEKREKKG